MKRTEMISFNAFMSVCSSWDFNRTYQKNLKKITHQNNLGMLRVYNMEKCSERLFFLDPITEEKYLIPRVHL